MDSSERTNLIIVSGPSGVGKSTLCNRLLAEHSDVLSYSISCTTRKPRGQERNNHEYHFVDRSEFEKLISTNYFAEWARVHDELYGTPKYQVEKANKSKKFLVMDINVEGAESLKKIYPESHTIFILPPSVSELKNRLKNRDGSKKSEELSSRLKVADEEIRKARSYDHQLVNSNFEETYAELRKIVEKIINSDSLS